MTTAIYFLGVDTGGTFTDFYCWSEAGARIHKVLSTPDAPEHAIVQGIEDLGLMPAVKRGEVAIVHGSTVATNAALEGKGVRTVLITNKGFADMLTLGRQNRADIYALQPADIKPPVPRSLCVEVDCRRDAEGRVVTPLTEHELSRVVKQVQGLNPAAVAINLLFSYLAPEEEQRLVARLPPSMFVSASHQVLPEYKEYERGMATWLNAWLGPKVEHYLKRLQNAVSPSSLAIMQSNAGTIDAEQASQKAANLLLSGPAGGLAAVMYIGSHGACDRLLTLDMGGTSTDVALIDGAIKMTSEGKLGPYPVAVPMVDLHTIGAGGGSLAYVDAGGLLHVGPESAGAEPGPACYGLGGCEPTVTDANAVLGRIRPDQFLGGRMSLNVAHARDAVAKVAQQMGVDVTAAAEGIIAVANEHMAAALRVISVQKGYHPAEFELCCFGGAGGLHVCALAEALHMTRVLIPANGGVLSAFGMLVAPRLRQLSCSVLNRLTQIDGTALKAQADALIEQGLTELAKEGPITAITSSVSVDCRYVGQSFSINLPWLGESFELEAAFHKAHQEQFGHRLPSAVEVVNLRVTVSQPALAEPTFVAPTGSAVKPREQVELPGLGTTEIWLRQDFAVGQMICGPAIICEPVATTLVAPKWVAVCDLHGHLRLTRQA